jgi:GTP cyclohydrolase II
LSNTKTIKKQAQAPLPTKNGTFQIIAYSLNNNDPMPHMVLINPETDFSKSVNVRIHSECMTGDVFSSRRCECGEQLDWSLDYTNRNGGLVIYLRQEGRGIGIINKLHAYQKQDEGFDTAEANIVLGFGYDDRTYDDAIAILEDLEIKEINLITNNPEKIKALDNCVLKVVSRVSVEIPPHAQNIGYLKTKKEFFGHKLDL